MNRLNNSRHRTLRITDEYIGRVKVESAKPSLAWSIKRTIDENLAGITVLLAIGIGIATTAIAKRR